MNDFLTAASHFVASENGRATLGLAEFVFLLSGVLMLVWSLILLQKAGYFEALRRRWDWFFPAEQKETSPDEWRESWVSFRESIGEAERNQYREIVLQADDFINAVLEERGVRGETLSDKLQNISPNQLSDLDQVVRAHNTAAALREREGAQPLEEDMQRVVDIYDGVLRELGAEDSNKMN